MVNKLQSVIQEARLKFSLTDGGKEGKVMNIASTGFLESIFYSRDAEGIGPAADNVEDLRIDFGKSNGEDGGVCVQRIGILKKTKEFRKVYVRTGTNTVLWMGVVSGRLWRPRALDITTRREVFRRQLASAVGKTFAVSFCFFFELEIEHELVCAARFSGHKRSGRSNGRKR